MKYMAHDPSVGPKSLSVKSCELPEYDKESEVLIKIEATACNRADLLQSQGKYPPPTGVTDIIGLECAGYLVDPVTNEITDRKVCALLSGGGYAEFAKVHRKHILDIPEGLSFEQAACIPEAWVTAYQLLVKVANI